MYRGEASLAYSLAHDGAPTVVPAIDTLSGKKFRERPRNVHKHPTPLLETGLVNFDYLSLYMHRNPWHVPLPRTPGWKYHHAYHTKTSYLQTDTHKEERDDRLVTFRNRSYNQLHLRVINEWIYHLYHRLQVPWPPEETVYMSLRDFSIIDNLGASTLALALTKGNVSQYRVDTVDMVPPAVQDVPARERIEFFEEMREDNRRALNDLEVIPERLATSAIQRLALDLRQDPYLMNLAATRLEHDPVFYPVRPPAHRTLQIIANKAISSEFSNLAQAA